jgi:site-specific DNA-adenine methylase
MFSYYGSKSKVVDYYPPPKYKRIIEPFAGSARYSLKYWQNDVLLVDKYEVIIKLWKWLQQCSTYDILGLPNLFRHDDIRNFNICDDAKLLIGFSINNGSIAPKNIVADFQNWNANKKQIAKNLHKIKHWIIKQGDYKELENETATWFIDPPYMFGGEHYKEPSTNIDFNKLAEWCMSRNGQVIVCENTKADWLPFKPMKEMKGCVYKTTEAIWSNCKTNYDNVQMTLF